MCKVILLEKVRVQRQIDSIDKQIVESFEASSFIDSFRISIMRQQLIALKAKLRELEKEEQSYEQIG